MKTIDFYRLSPRWLLARFPAIYLSKKCLSLLSGKSWAFPEHSGILQQENLSGWVRSMALKRRKLPWWSYIWRIKLVMLLFYSRRNPSFVFESIENLSHSCPYDVFVLKTQNGSLPLLLLLATVYQPLQSPLFPFSVATFQSRISF